MFRSLMTIIRELYLYLTKVIYIYIYVKTLGKITSLCIVGDVAVCRRATCAALRHAARSAC